MLPRRPQSWRGRRSSCSAMSAAEVRGLSTLGMVAPSTVPTSLTCRRSSRTSLWSLTVQQVHVRIPVMASPSNNTSTGATWRRARPPSTMGATGPRDGCTQLAEVQGRGTRGLSSGQGRRFARHPSSSVRSSSRANTVRAASATSSLERDYPSGLPATSPMVKALVVAVCLLAGAATEGPGSHAQNPTPNRCLARSAPSPNCSQWPGCEL